MYFLACFQWPEAAIFVYHHEGLILNVYFHVEQAVTVHVFETERDRGQVLAVAKQGGDRVNSGFGWISPRHFYDQNMPV